MTISRPPYLGRPAPARTGLGDQTLQDWYKQNVAQSDKLIQLQATPQVQCTGTGATNLMSCVIPANLLALNDEGIVIQAFGYCAANANNKTIALQIGGVPVYTTGAAAANGTAWSIDITMLRQAAASQVVIGEGKHNNALVGATYTALTQAMTTADTTVQVIGTGGATGDIVQVGMVTKLLQGFNYTTGQ